MLKDLGYWLVRGVALWLPLYGLAGWIAATAVTIVAFLVRVAIDRRLYRIVTRGRSWAPSRDPADYR